MLHHNTAVVIVSRSWPLVFSLLACVACATQNSQPTFNVHAQVGSPNEKQPCNQRAAVAFLAGYNAQLILMADRGEPTGRHKGSPGALKNAMSTLGVNSESLKAIEQISELIAMKHGEQAASQFRAAAKVTEDCLYFGDNLPKAIEIELEDLVKQFGLPPALEEVPTQSFSKWLEQLRDHFMAQLCGQQG